jgi:hypothetical protein
MFIESLRTDIAKVRKIIVVIRLCRYDNACCVAERRGNAA